MSDPKPILDRLAAIEQRLDKLEKLIGSQNTVPTAPPIKKIFNDAPMVGFPYDDLDKR